MKLSMKLITVKSRLSNIYIEGSQDLISNQYYISFSEDRCYLGKHCKSDKFCIMQHIIEVIIICQSSYSGVSRQKI